MSLPTQSILWFYDHSSKIKQWECEHAGFICSKVYAASTSQIKYVATYLLKFVTAIQWNAMGIWNCICKIEDQTTASLMKRSFSVSMTIREISAEVAQSVERLKGGSCSHSLSVFSSLVSYWSNLTFAMNFHQQGKFHYAVAKSLLYISSNHICWWIYTRRHDIYTCTTWDCSSNFGETASYISRTF